MPENNRSKNRAAGARFQKKIECYLQSLGFQVDTARNLLKILWIRNKITGQLEKIYVSSKQDFMGCADHIAVHPKIPYTIFIQAHAGTSDKPRLEKLAAVRWNFKVQIVQLWTRQESIVSGIRVRTLRQQGDAIGWTEAIFRLKEGLWPPVEVFQYSNETTEVTHASNSRETEAETRGQCQATRAPGDP